MASITGKSGKDWIFGTSSNDIINAKDRNDTVYGGAGKDTLNGGKGDDKLMGGSGNDTLNGNAGINTAYYKGSALNYSFSSINSKSFKIADSIASRDGTDLLNGIQYLQFNTTLATTSRAKLGPVTTVATFSFHSPRSSLYHIIQGTNANNTLTGDKPGALTNKDLLLGFNGNDTIDGKAGNDIAFGNSGNDTFLHNVTLNIGAHDYYDGGAGTDTLNLNVSYAQYVSLFQSGALSTFSSWNKAAVFNFSIYVPSIGLKVVNIENLVTPNYAPIAQNDPLIASTDQNTIKTISGASLVANDTDPVPGNTLSVASISGDTHFSLVNGNVVFTPGTDFQYLAQGQSTTLSFTYVVQDQNGIKSANAATASITINGVNDLAHITGTATGSVTEDGILNQSGVLTVTDPDLGETHFQTPSSLNGSYGIFTFNSLTGAWDYTLNNLDPIVQALAQDAIVHDQLTVTSVDGTASQVIDVTITGTNDAPTGSATTMLTAGTEDTAYTLSAASLLQGFSDVDTGDTLSVSNLVANHGTVVDNLDGTFTITPELNYNGLVSLTYNVTDGHGGSIAASQSFSLAAVNDAPVVANALADVSSAEDTAINFTIPSNTFSDVDNATLTLSATLDTGAALPIWLSFNASTGAFSGTPPQDFNGSMDVKVTASDGQYSVSDTFTLNITPVNDAPAAVTDPITTTTDQNTGITILGSTLVANDTDPDAGHVLSVASLGAGSDHHFSLVNGDVVFTPGSDFVSLAQGQSTTLSFTYFVQDEHGELSTTPATASITITGTNDAPVVTAVTAQSGIENQNFVSSTFANSFADVDTGDTLALTATMANGDPLPSWLQFDGTTFSGMPPVMAGTAPQDLSIKVTATDSHGLQAFQTFTLEIQQNPSLFDHNLMDTSLHFLAGTPSAAVSILNMPDTSLATLASDLSFSINIDGHYAFSLNDGTTNFGNAQFTDLTPASGTSVTFNIDRFNDGVDATLTVTLGTDGNDTIVSSGLVYGLNGNDTLTGSADNDILNGGEGNDTIVGDVYEGTFGIYAYSYNSSATTSFTFGADSIDGGAGSDTLVGDVYGGDYGVNPSLYYSTASQNFIFGVDTLSGGTGDDILAGDVYGGTYGVYVYSDYYSTTSQNFTFGADTLSGGTGNDTLVGDMYGRYYGVYVYSDYYSTASQNFTFGADTLEGGAGNDILIGDVNSITLSGTGTPPTFTFASDTFVYNLSDLSPNALGNDTIKDFNVGGINDKLEFKNLTDVNGDGHIDINDLAALTSVVDDGHGGAMIMLYNNIAHDVLVGSIDLQQNNIGAGFTGGVAFTNNSSIVNYEVTSSFDLGQNALVLQMQAIDPYIFNYQSSEVHGLRSLAPDVTHVIRINNMPDMSLTTLNSVLDFSINANNHYDFTLNNGSVPFGYAELNNIAPAAGTSVTFNIDTSNDGVDATLNVTLGTDGNDSIMGSGLIYGLNGDDTLTGSADNDILNGGEGNDTLIGYQQNTNVNDSLATAQVIDRGNFGTLAGSAVPYASDFGDQTLPSVNIQGAINVANDKDFYKVSLHAGETLRMDIDETTGNGDTVLAILDSTGALLASADGGTAPGETYTVYNSYLAYTAPSDGDYYIGVSAYPLFITTGGLSSGSSTLVFSYHLNLSLQTTSTDYGSVASVVYETESYAGGNDILNGGAGNDTLFSGEGNDTLNGGDGSDTVSYVGALSGVTVDLSQASSQDTGGAGIDTLTSIENIIGSDLNDTLTGTAGDNVINGGAGNDIMSGGAGNDAYIIDSTADVVIENPNAGTDLVLSSVSYTLSDNVENLTLTGTSAINGTGNALDNAIIGNSVNNILTGGAGADTLDGGAGNNTASYAGATTDITASLADSSTNTGDAQGDTYTNIQNLAGSSFNDTLTGDGANNILTGDVYGGSYGIYLYNVTGINSFTFGNDILSGGDGNDTLVGDTYGGSYGIYSSSYNSSATTSFTFGADSIDGSIGNDTLVGDSYGGYYGIIYSYSYNQSATTSFTFGADSIDGGIGNDTLVGDSYGEYYGIYSSSSNQSATTSFTFGVDSIDGGAGNDTLAGDSYGGTYYGVYSSSSNQSSTTSFTFGTDSIDGGVGNDTLVGDSYGGYYGIYSSSSNQSATTSFTFGADTLSGGTGDDILAGDVYGGTSGIYAYSNLNATSIQNFVFGADTLEGGAGNDILIGDVNSITLSGTGTPPTFTFDSDTFGYNLSDLSPNALGNDIIKDFNVGVSQGQAAADNLSFHNVMDVVHTNGTAGADGTIDIQDLLALTDVVNDGSGGAKINIYNYAATGDHTAPITDTMNFLVGSIDLQQNNIGAGFTGGVAFAGSEITDYINVGTIHVTVL